MNKKIIVGNWKMNPKTLEEAEGVFNQIKKTASELKNVEVVICPPSVYVSNLKSKIPASPAGGSNLKLGAQDVSVKSDTDPYTGEVSAPMLKNLGVEYAIIGHSERRAMSETNEIINKKIKTTLKAGLKVIFCVGENERDEEGRFFDFIKKEIEDGLEGVNKEFFGNIIVAYEPVWSISSGEKFQPDDPGSVFKVAAFIKKTLASSPVLYGGSVTASTAKDFLEKGNIDGLLVGSKSLIPEEFNKILEIAEVL